MRYEINFSKNLVFYRKKQNLTQQALADKIGYSAKSVSKWESAKGFPSIQTVIEISKILNVSLDELLLVKDERLFFLGIDGGGTKTQVLITDAKGSEIKKVLAEGCNPIDIGAENAKKILEKAIYEACEGIPFGNIMAFAGIAGGISGDMKKIFADFFKTFQFKAVENDSDNRNIIAAGLGEHDGISLILGTGICAYLQKNQKRRSAGGKGYLIDNGGSAYNIGRDGLHAYFCEKDGIGKATLITTEIEKICEGTPRDILGQIYKGGKKEIASFAKVVYAAAKNGDEIAESILKRNMREAAYLVESLAKSLEQTEIPLVIAGGLTKDSLTLEYLKDALSDAGRFRIQVLDKEPVYGAVMLAEKLCNKPDVGKK